MKVAFITQYYPWPVRAGNAFRLDNLIGIMQDRGWACSLIYVGEEKIDESVGRNRLGGFLHICRESSRKPLHLRLRGLFVRAAALLARQLEHLEPKGVKTRASRFLWLRRQSVDYSFNPRAAKAVTDVLRAISPDMVIAEYIFTTRYLAHVPPGVLKVVDTHDTFTRRHERLAAAGCEIGWLSVGEKDEIRALNRADCVLAIQENEAFWFAGKTRARVLTLKPAVRLDQTDIPLGSRSGLLFIGSNNAVNVAAARWLIDELLPLLRPNGIEHKLLLVGPVCAAISAAPGVELVGMVDDLAVCYKKARVVVNPVFGGTGLKIKVLEALGHGLPVVTTGAGAEGLSEAVGKCIWLGDERASFAKGVSILCSDDTRWHEYSRQSAAYLEKWSIQAEQCLDEIAILTKKKQGLLSVPDQEVGK